MKDVLLVVLLVVALFLIGVSIVLAHGSAQWIMDDQNYVSSKLNPELTTHCCGPSDCEPWPASDVEVTTQGYRLKSTGELIEFDRAFWTRPDKIQESEFWRCHFTTDNIAAKNRYGQKIRMGETRCFWAPAGAS